MCVFFVVFLQQKRQNHLLYLYFVTFSKRVTNCCIKTNTKKSKLRIYQILKANKNVKQSAEFSKVNIAKTKGEVKTIQKKRKDSSKQKYFVWVLYIGEYI